MVGLQGVKTKKRTWKMIKEFFTNGYGFYGLSLVSIAICLKFVENIFH